MVWERIDELQALRIAIQSEIDSHNLYREAIKHVRDKQGKELLRALAEEEKRHRRELEQEYARVSGKRLDRKSTRLNSSHIPLSRMPSSA